MINIPGCIDTVWKAALRINGRNIVYRHGRRTCELPAYAVNRRHETLKINSHLAGLDNRWDFLVEAARLTLDDTTAYVPEIGDLIEEENGCRFEVVEIGKTTFEYLDSNKRLMWIKTTAHEHKKRY